MKVLKVLAKPALLSTAFVAATFLVPAAVDKSLHELGFESQSVMPSAHAEASKKTRRKLPGLREKFIKELQKAQSLASPPENEKTGVTPPSNFPGAYKVLAKLEKRCKDECNGYEKAQMYQTYAWISATQEKNAEAIKYHQKVVDQSPMLPLGTELNSYKTMAQLAASIDKLGDAAKYITKYIELADDVSADIYYMRGYLCYYNEDKVCSLRDVNKAVAMVEGRGKIAKQDWYVLQNALYMEKEDYKTSLKILEKLIVNYPKKSYWSQMGSIYGLLEKDQEQLDVLSAAYLMKGPSSRGSLTNLAILYINSGMPYYGAKVLEKGLADGVLDRSERNLDMLAKAWRHARHPEKAVPIFKEASEKFASGELYGELMAAYLDMDDFKSAVSAGKKALKLGKLKSEGRIHIDMGIAYFEMKKYNSAIKSFTQAAKDKKSKRFATTWLKHTKSEKKRADAIAAAWADLKAES